MTKIEEIVERVAKQRDDDIKCYWDRSCGVVRSCSMCDKRNLAIAVARAVVEEAAHACERTEVLSYHCVEAVALRAAASKIRALAAPSAGKENR